MNKIWIRRQFIVPYLWKNKPATFSELYQQHAMASVCLKSSNLWLKSTMRNVTALYSNILTGTIMQWINMQRGNFQLKRFPISFSAFLRATMRTRTWPIYGIVEIPAYTGMIGFSPCAFLSITSLSLAMWANTSLPWLKTSIKHRPNAIERDKNLIPTNIQDNRKVSF